jgi:hypothetical protein
MILSLHISLLPIEVKEVNRQKYLCIPKMINDNQVIDTITTAYPRTILREKIQKK